MMRSVLVSLQPLALVVLGFLATPSWQYVSIELKNGSRSLGDKHKYEDDSVFTYRHANFPKDGKLSGYVWRWSDSEFPMDGCQYIEPLSDAVKADGSRWFALIEDLSSCPGDMVKNVRNAGFDLVIGYTKNSSSSAPDLTKSLRDSDFPIVAVSGDYVVETLWVLAATNTSINSVHADVEVADLDDLIIGFSAGFLVLSLTLFLFFCCLIYCRWRARRRGLYSFPRTGGNPFNQRYAQARLARQELIESILRQLQELQIEHRGHPPLGEEATRALPQKTFAEAARRESSGKEMCAICVEEFQEDDVVRILPCSHFFHPHCIDPWLTEHSSMCPLCKQPVSEQNEQPPGLRPPYEINPLSSSSVSFSSLDSESADDFGTPTAVTPVPLVPTDPPSFASVRGSSVNDDSSSSASSNAPLIDSTNR